MAAADLGECFRQYRFRAVKVECQRAYRAGGAEAVRIQAARDGAPRPERSVRTNDYLREVALDVLVRGRDRQRLLIADHPLGDYWLQRLPALIESQAAGERTLVAVRAGGTALAQAELAGITHDFWLFDDGTAGAFAVIMHYDAEGAWLDGAFADPAELTVCQNIAAAIAGHAVPLNEYLATDLATGAAACPAR